MNQLPKTTAKTNSPQELAEEIKSLKKAVGLLLSMLPENARISVQKALLESQDSADRDLATQINQFIFHDDNKRPL